MEHIGAVPDEREEATEADYTLVTELNHMQLVVPTHGSVKVGVPEQPIELPSVSAAKRHGVLSAGTPLETEGSASSANPGATGHRHVAFGQSGSPNIPKLAALPRQQLHNATGGAFEPAPYTIGRVHLPTSAELPTLEDHVSEHLVSLGQQTLRVFLYPRLLLRSRLMARKRLLAIAQDSAPKLTTQLVATVPMFKQWPADVLALVVKEATLCTFEPREFIVYEDERPYAMYFVVSGTVKMLTRLTAANSKQNHSPAHHQQLLRSGKSDGRRKAFSSSNVVQPAPMLVSPGSFGSNHLLTNEQYPYAVRTIGKVDAYCLTRTAFARVVASLPAHSRNLTIATAFERRNEKMRTHYPITPEILQNHCSLFSQVSNDFASALIDRLEAAASPADLVLATGGANCDAMILLRSGTLGFFRTVGGGHHHHHNHHHHGSVSGTSTERTAHPSGRSSISAPTEHLVQTVHAPSVINDMALLYNATNEMTIKTLTDCDLYKLPLHLFQAVCQQYPLDVDRMLDAARLQRKSELQGNHHSFRAVLAKMPIFNKLIPVAHEKEFLSLLQPRSYRAMSCICSKATFCDRIIVLTKGQLTLGTLPAEEEDLEGGGERALDASTGNMELSQMNASSNSASNVRPRKAAGLAPNSPIVVSGTMMNKWESIGWTCCVPHRWAYSAMTLNKAIEVLEVSYLDFMLFLHERNLLEKATQTIKMLMFPRAFAKETIDEVYRGILPHFPMYPVSKSLKINFHEIGFCEVHMHTLEEDQRTQREEVEKQNRKLPPPYKQLSRGVWVPSTTKVLGFTTMKDFSKKPNK